jgi:hypothetical protein
MSEAEFERRQGLESGEPQGTPATNGASLMPTPPADSEPTARGSSSPPAPTKPRASRGKPAKSRRVQRMFAIEEDVDKKLWLYAIHVGKDRSEVVNDLLRPLVASMVLYDSRDRRAAGRVVEAEGQGESVES